MCKDEVLQVTLETLSCFDLTFSLFLSCIDWEGVRERKWGESGKREKERIRGRRDSGRR